MSKYLLDNSEVQRITAISILREGEPVGRIVGHRSKSGGFKAEMWLDGKFARAKSSGMGYSKFDACLWKLCETLNVSIDLEMLERGSYIQAFEAIGLKIVVIIGG